MRRTMHIVYPHKKELVERLHSCLDMCRIPHDITDDYFRYDILIDRGNCSWEQVMKEVNRVFPIKFRYTNEYVYEDGQFKFNLGTFYYPKKY